MVWKADYEQSITNFHVAARKMLLSCSIRSHMIALVNAGHNVEKLTGQDCYCPCLTFYALQALAGCVCCKFQEPSLGITPGYETPA